MAPNAGRNGWRPRHEPRHHTPPPLDDHNGGNPVTPGKNLFDNKARNDPPNNGNKDAMVRDNTARKVLLKLMNENICKLSPFLIKKVLDGYIGRAKFVKKLRSEELLIKTVSAQQTEKLLQMKKFHSYDVTCRTPYNINTVKGVISYPGFNYMEDSELIDARADQ